LPYASSTRAVEEVHRVAKMGLKGLDLSCSWDMEPMWHPSREPFWKAVDEVQLPLHCHTFPTTPPRPRQEGAANPPRGDVHRRLGVPDGAHPHHRGGDGAGVFERYPCLRVSFGESGAGWLAYALHHMDFEFEDRFRDLMRFAPERILSSPVQGDVPVRPDQRQAHRRDRRRCRLGTCLCLSRCRAAWPVLSSPVFQNGN
jgi:predicted TIM-barrel fold metal-dependent hydrolase